MERDGSAYNGRATGVRLVAAPCARLDFFAVDNLRLLIASFHLILLSNDGSHPLTWTVQPPTALLHAPARASIFAL
jgi:hypothetical protein